MHVRDRVVELRRVPGAQLLPNPRNWRRHTSAQQQALRGVLAEVGFAGALLARELPDGRLQLIDGHLRTETLPDEVLPVLVLDVNEREAAQLLATFDPLGAMAEADADALQQLLDQLAQDAGSRSSEPDGDAAALQAMLDQLARDSGIAPSAFEPPAPGPASSYREQYGVIVLCADEAEQRAVYERLAAQGLTCKVVVT